MNALCILGAVLIVMWACSPALAILIGRGIRLADHHETPAAGAGGGTGEVPPPPARGARHLRSAR